MLQIARFLLHELLMRYAGMVDFEYNSGATLDVATSSIRDNLKSLGSYQTTRDTLFGKWKPLQKHSWLFRGCSCTVARCHVLWKFWRSNVSARMAPQSLVQGGVKLHGWGLSTAYACKSFSGCFQELPRTATVAWVLAESWFLSLT